MFDINKIIKDYLEGKSIREIADLYQTYPNKVARLIKKSGVELRSKKEAGKLAFDHGKINPPMLGKKRTQAEKDNVSNKRAKKWKEMSEQDLEIFKKNAKDRWESQTEEERISKQKKAGQALRRATTEGSKAEKFLYEGLTKLGYDVIIHKVGLIPGEKFEIDLYLPKLMVAIEIDGPQHFLPIYGEESLRRSIKYDIVKSGALLSRGLCVIRVKYMLKHTSQKTNRTLLKLVEAELNKISQNFPEPRDRLIELEINND
jgi:very-short-patch-repair endonuclease